jgi:hypothetical protein
LNALLSILSLALLAACGAGSASQSSTTTAGKPAAMNIICPTATPGRPVAQSLIQPPNVPEYPNAQDLQVATAQPSLPLETPDLGLTEYRLTVKITRFTTSESRERVLDFYRDALLIAGWSLVEHRSAEDKLSFGWSVEATVIAAWNNIPCAPTPETGLPGHGLDLMVVETERGTRVELKQSVYPGY